MQTITEIMLTRYCSSVYIPNRRRLLFKDQEKILKVLIKFKRKTKIKSRKLVWEEKKWSYQQKCFFESLVSVHFHNVHYRIDL